eukprot:COSAG04_NODE_2309_length_4350_cov_3.518231_3_plen_146_part_00
MITPRLKAVYAAGEHLLDPVVIYVPAGTPPPPTGVAVLQHPLGAGLRDGLERIGRHVKYTDLPPAGGMVSLPSRTGGQWRFLRSEAEMAQIIANMIQAALQPQVEHARSAGSWSAFDIPTDLEGGGGRLSSGVMLYGLPFLVFHQ